MKCKSFLLEGKNKINIRTTWRDLYESLKNQNFPCKKIGGFDLSENLADPSRSTFSFF